MYSVSKRHFNRTGSQLSRISLKCFAQIDIAQRPCIISKASKLFRPVQLITDREFKRLNSCDLIDLIGRLQRVIDRRQFPACVKADADSWRGITPRSMKLVCVMKPYCKERH